MLMGGGLSSVETFSELRLASGSQAMVKQLPMPQESDLNPYVPPQSQRLVDESSPEAIRRVHIRHEANIKAVGSLYAFFGVIMALGLLNMGWQMVLGGYTKKDLVSGLWLSLAALLALALGGGLQTLVPRVRIPVVIVSILLGIVSLVSIVGPLMNGYVIWLMLVQKGRTVMSPDYRKIVELTPHVKHQSSVRAVFLILVLVLFILSVLGVLLIPATSDQRPAKHDNKKIIRIERPR